MKIRLENGYPMELLQRCILRLVRWRSFNYNDFELEYYKEMLNTSDGKNE